MGVKVNPLDSLAASEELPLLAVRNVSRGQGRKGLARVCLGNRTAQGPWEKQELVSPASGGGIGTTGDRVLGTDFDVQLHRGWRCALRTKGSKYSVAGLRRSRKLEDETSGTKGV